MQEPHSLSLEPCPLPIPCSLAAFSWAWQGLLRRKLDKETPAHTLSAHQRPGTGWQTPGCAVMGTGRQRALMVGLQAQARDCQRFDIRGGCQGGTGVSWARRSWGRNLCKACLSCPLQAQGQGGPVLELGYAGVHCAEGQTARAMQRQALPVTQAQESPGRGDRACEKTWLRRGEGQTGVLRGASPHSALGRGGRV